MPGKDDINLFVADSTLDFHVVVFGSENCSNGITKSIALFHS
jgi:hypothetical protein